MADDKRHTPERRRDRSARRAGVPAPLEEYERITRREARRKAIAELLFKDRARTPIVEVNKGNYTPDTMDAAAKIKAAAELLSSVYPAEVVGKTLEDLAANAAREATTRATAKPRLKWNKDNRPDENPAEFAWRAYQAEAKARTLHRGVIGQEDKPLAVKLASWLRSHDMPEGIDIPTKPEWITRQAEAGKAKPATAPRTESQRIYDALRHRQKRALRHANKM